jgi:tetratricopeptide (TPR) repeat protein
MVRRTLVGRVAPSSLLLAVALFALPAHAGNDTPAEGAAAPAAVPTDAAIREASEHYEAGLELYADGEFKRAAIEFDRAYELVPNYRALYNIGQVRIQLHDYARAMKALQAYLKEGGEKIDADRKKTVHDDLEMLATRTATLGIETNEPGVEVLVDGEPAGVTPMAEPLLLDTGDRRLVLRKDGFYPREETITLASKDALSMRFDLVKLEKARDPVVFMAPSTPQTSDRTAWIWGTWSATAAFAAGAGVTGILGINAAEDLANKRNTLGSTRDQLDSAQRRSETLLRVADILGGAAIVTGGVALYLTLSKPSAPKDKKGHRAEIHVSPRSVSFATVF